MNEWTGTLEFHDLGAGVWTLKTQHGRFQLGGAIDEALRGKKVVVHGQSESVMGFGMASDGKAIVVARMRPA